MESEREEVKLSARGCGRRNEELQCTPRLLCISSIYPIVGIALGRATFGYDFIPLLYPLAAGFALIGPVAAIGLYELSRRRELGLDTSWKHAFDVIHSPSLRAIVALELLLLVIFCIWLAVANAIYVANFGEQTQMTLSEFARNVLTTREGQKPHYRWQGNRLPVRLAGVFSEFGFVPSAARSRASGGSHYHLYRSDLQESSDDGLWGMFVAGAFVIGSLPFLVGLAVVMPVLGHSTWHLYRRLVEPDLSPRPEFHPEPKRRHYAADFPVSLFAPPDRNDVP